MQSKDVLDRLTKIERQLAQLKVIMLTVLFFLLFISFAPKELVLPVGIGILSLAILGTGIYCILRILEVIMNIKYGDKDKELEQELLREFGRQAKESNENT